MRKEITSLFLLFFVFSKAMAQAPVQNDSSINNMVHIPGYTPSEYGAIPQYIKSGKGDKTIILIPGLGFDASVFEDFMKANEKNYTMYAVTIPGFGPTYAPPMPDTTISYGEQTWNNSMIEGLIKLIEKEKLNKPIIVGHFVQGSQVAIHLAIEHPDKVSAVIILGGSVQFMMMQQDKLIAPTLQQMVDYTDKVTAKVWFRHMRKDFFDNGNFVKEMYSVNEKTGEQLWEQVASVPMPVMVRYSCEYFASDLLSEIKKLQCPLLVLRATFTSSFKASPMYKNSIQPQFIESWNMAVKENPSIQVKDIAESGTFIWKDKPAETYNEIKKFINGLK